MNDARAASRTNIQPHDDTASVPSDRLLRSSEAARFLAISERTLWDISTPRGTLPTVRMGKTVRYLRDDLLAWARKQSQGAA
jgi:predicted DNA-binding transcriptional regulator AlpA